MTFLVSKPRPWILFLNRCMSVYAPYSEIKTKKYVNMYIYLNSHGIHNSVQKFARRTLNSKVSDEAIEDLYFEHDSSVEKEARAISNLQTVFGLNEVSAIAMINKYPVLKSVSLESAQRNVDYFTNNGLSMKTLKKNPLLLTYKIETVSPKLKILRKLELGDLKTILPLLQLTFYRLKEISKMEERENNVIPQGNRIKYTCKKLQCDMAEACKVFGQHEFLYSIPFTKYSYIMEKLLEAGISPSYIIRDVWVFQYGIKKIETRLAILREVGVNPIKPWMLRSSPKTFETTLQRVLSRREVLGENSVVEYLTQQLECDVKTVEFLTSKYPTLLRKHVPKLNELFDFLYAEGFTPQQVIQVPRILFYNVETIKSRLTELREAGSNPTSLMTLCKSKREFTKIVEIALKRKLRILSDT